MPRIPVEEPTYRLIPSRFPPIGAFDDVSSPQDLLAVMELEGWTNDRLVRHRLARLPETEWVYGVPNASVVMAAFLHAAAAGLRFSGSDLGAWYAAYRVQTAVAEVAHHVRRELAHSGAEEMVVQYRTYAARLAGDFVDIKGQAMPDLYDATSYVRSQSFGEAVRGSDLSGIRYDSVRHAGGVNIVCYRPSHIRDVTQAEHYALTIRREGKIVARLITG